MFSMEKVDSSFLSIHIDCSVLNNSYTCSILHIGNTLLNFHCSKKKKMQWHVSTEFTVVLSYFLYVSNFVQTYERNFPGISDIEQAERISHIFWQYWKHWTCVSHCFFSKYTLKKQVWRLHYHIQTQTATEEWICEGSSNINQTLLYKKLLIIIFFKK